MNRPRQFKKRFTIYLLAALLILALAFPAVAGAYVARSSGGAIPGYGMARSQPQYKSSPAAPSHPSPQPEEPAGPVEPAPTVPVSPPSKPAYNYNGGSYGRARSGSGGYSGWSPPSSPSNPVTPPAQPEEPEKPADPKPPVTPPPAGGDSVTLSPQERELFELVNSERVSRGLAPLQLNTQLTYLARLKSQDMADLNYFAHESPTYGRSGDMLRNAGFKFSLAAENIGMGGSIKAIFNAFMNSSGHRSKIVGSRYTHTGVGVVYKPGRGYLVTQLFVVPR
ncbi:MAG TPA: CAP domain-containing protein [Bacillota bacterium]|nr:CAP domain-containing protein [Bacillota bacterium]HOL14884.1 CAP domain-containing protein [Bacillota bacterium]